MQSVGISKFSKNVMAAKRTVCEFFCNCTGTFYSLQ